MQGAIPQEKQPHPAAEPPALGVRLLAACPRAAGLCRMPGRLTQLSVGRGSWHWERTVCQQPCPLRCSQRSRGRRAQLCLFHAGRGEAAEAARAEALEEWNGAVPASSNLTWTLLAICWRQKLLHPTQHPQRARLDSAGCSILRESRWTSAGHCVGTALLLHAPCEGGGILNCAVKKHPERS